MQQLWSRLLIQDTLWLASWDGAFIPMFGSRETWGRYVIKDSYFYSSNVASRQHHEHQRYVAVKILSAHAIEVQGRLANELEILQHINSNDTKAHPGRNHLSTLLDHFTVMDHHGPHLCLVFEVSGAFNGPIYNPGRTLSVPLVKNIARQLLFALDFLHRECGIIHTGALVLLSYSFFTSTLPGLSRKTLNPTIF